MIAQIAERAEIRSGMPIYSAKYESHISPFRE
jgi:hypothetical protein